MDIRIKNTNYTMPPGVADYLSKKLDDVEKLLDEREGEARCEVEVGRAAGHAERGNVWRAEINLIYRGRNFRAEAQGETVNAAIDEVKDEMIRQIHRERKLHIRLVRRGGTLFKRMIQFGRDIR